MNLVEIILLSVALGIDCFVVSFSNGLIFKENRLKNSLLLALTMGLCQGLMPVVGYVGTNHLRSLILPYSKWIVFAIFLTLGLKFIFDSFNDKDEKLKCLDLKCIVALGIATSIDALVSGAGLNLLSAPIILSCVLIGLTSFIMSISGFWVGNFVKFIPQKYLEIFGGLILILLALKGL